jgi:hypothetical protein
MFSQYEFFPLATRTFVKCSTAECRIGAVAIRLGRKPAVPVVIVSLIFAAESDLPARPVQWVRCRRVCAAYLCAARARHVAASGEFATSMFVFFTLSR